MEIRNKYGVKVGDIFHSKWGYNMINHDFYKVIRFKANPDGTAYIIVNKRKLDGNFGVRELSLCLISYHNDFKLENSYKIVDECM